MSNTSRNLSQLFQSMSAKPSGGLSHQSAQILTSNLNKSKSAAKSAVGIQAEALDTTVVTLLQIIIDATASMQSNAAALVDAYNQMLQSLKSAKSAETILVSTILFNQTSTVLHGYQPLANVKELDHTVYRPDNQTALYDAVIDGFTGLIAYGRNLRDNGIHTRMISVVFTDGIDVRSRNKAEDVKTIADDLMRQEVYTLALVAFGFDAHQVAANMGFPNVLNTGSTPTEIRRAVNLVSASVIQQSQALPPTVQPGQSQSNNFFNP